MRLSADGLSRRVSLAAAAGFLAAALLSKAYHGPWHVYAKMYLGDLWIVGFIHFVLVAAVPRVAPLGAGGAVFGLAVAAEVLQALAGPALAGLPGWLSFWTGAVFDPVDLVFYAVGTGIAVLTHVILRRRTSGRRRTLSAAE